MNTSIETISADSVGGRKDEGFTLVEILIAIVLVGILSVVVIVGISNLTSSGSKSACTASLDAAKAGTVAYFASNNKYPINFTELTPAVNPALVLPTGSVIAPDGLQVTPTATNPNWTLTMTAGATGVAPTFACS